MRFRLEQLEILVNLAESNSMRLCAENLHTTKANISKSITQMEASLNATLFFKSHKGCYLTPFGEVVYKHAKAAIAHCESIESLALQRSNDNSVVRVIYSDAQLSTAYALTSYLERELSAISVRTMSTPTPHEDYFGVDKVDALVGVIMRNDLDLLMRWSEHAALYIMYESPLYVVYKNKPNLLPLSIGEEISSANLKKLKLLTVGSDPFHGDKPTQVGNVFTGFFERRGITSKTQIALCNTISMAELFLDRGYVLLADGFTLANNIKDQIDKDEYRYARVKPEESVIRYIAIGKNSKYYAVLSESLVQLGMRHSELIQQITRM